MTRMQAHTLCELGLHCRTHRELKEVATCLWEEVKGNSSCKMVTEFHQAFGLPVGDGSIPERLDLRTELIKEEARELVEAAELLKAEGSRAAKVKLLDALADLKYVVEGMAIEFGWDLEKAFLRVHKSNMTKLGPDGKPIYREDGKVLKGPNFQPPKLDDLV